MHLPIMTCLGWWCIKSRVFVHFCSVRKLLEVKILSLSKAYTEKGFCYCPGHWANQYRTVSSTCSLLVFLCLILKPQKSFLSTTVNCSVNQHYWNVIQPFIYYMCSIDLMVVLLPCPMLTGTILLMCYDNH